MSRRERRQKQIEAAEREAHSPSAGADSTHLSESEHTQAMPQAASAPLTRDEREAHDDTVALPRATRSTADDTRPITRGDDVTPHGGGAGHDAGPTGATPAGATVAAASTREASAATTSVPAAAAASSVNPPTKRDEMASKKDKESRDGGRTAPGAESAGGTSRGKTSKSKRDDDKPPPSAARRWLDRLILIAAVWAIWAFITTFVVQPFRIPSSSMENTLQIGDRIVVQKWTPRFTDVKRGDVVVFKDPGDWTDPVPSSNAVVGAIRKVAEVTHLSASGSHLVKRVIGVGGDKVACAGPGQKLTVNGVAINEPYLKPGVQPCQDKFAITVPAEKVWVMGDNRSDSADSRYHDDGTGALGSVPVSDITGRSLAVIWPIGNLSGGHNDEDAFSKVPAATK